MTDGITHALNIGSFALWLSACAACTVAIWVPGNREEIVVENTGSGGEEGPVFLTNEAPAASSASRPAARTALRSPAPAFPSPPVTPMPAPSAPLPDLPDFAARDAAGGSLANRLAAGDTPGPAYPPHSKRMGQTGTAVVRFTIDATGRVINASIYSSSGWPLLDSEALRTVRSWRYPGGEALSMVRPIVFRLP